MKKITIPEKGKEDMKIVCCQCGKVIEKGDGINVTASHGLCPECFEIAMKPVREAQALKAQQNT